MTEWPSNSCWSSGIITRSCGKKVHSCSCFGAAKLWNVLNDCQATFSGSFQHQSQLEHVTVSSTSKQKSWCSPCAFCFFSVCSWIHQLPSVWFVDNGALSYLWPLLVTSVKYNNTSSTCRPLWARAAAACYLHRWWSRYFRGENCKLVNRNWLYWWIRKSFSNNSLSSNTPACWFPVTRLVCEPFWCRWNITTQNTSLVTVD